MFFSEKKKKEKKKNLIHSIILHMNPPSFLAVLQLVFIDQLNFYLLSWLLLLNRFHLLADFFFYLFVYTSCFVSHGPYVCISIYSNMVTKIFKLVKSPLSDQKVWNQQTSKDFDVGKVVFLGGESELVNV